MAKDAEVSIGEYLKSKKVDVCKLIDKILTELSSDERLSAAPTNQLASILGALIDRFGADEKTAGLSDGVLSELFEDFEEVK